MSTIRAGLRLPAGVELPGEGTLELALDVIAPEDPLPVALVCLPGGGMKRKYYDLEAPGDDSFSFARQMAAQGFICVLIDHLGVGESSRPADGYALTPEVVMRANGNVTAAILQKLRDGSAVPGLKALPNLRSIGVGHSMGAMFTILQQAALKQHAGIAVLGFSTRGLPEFMPKEAKAMDQSTQRRELVRLARAAFKVSYPVIGRSEEGTSLYSGKAAEPAGVQAIKPVREHLLPVPAFMSMFPGNVAPEAAQIDVPVLVGLGERDMAGPPLDAPKAFTASPAVTFELFPEAGHSHFLFPSRKRLFARLGEWARGVAGQ